MNRKEVAVIVLIVAFVIAGLALLAQSGAFVSLDGSHRYNVAAKCVSICRADQTYTEDQCIRLCGNGNH